VPDGEPPTLEELNKYLDGLGMTWYNWPDRIEIRQQLPRNTMGKVERAVLRAELDQPVGGPADVRTS
jgi:non-ribosomal peptide synthetase component E (peptide arylation enzyme)